MRLSLASVQNPDGLDSRNKNPTEERILFALTEAERSQFFPLADAEFVENANCIEWVTPEVFASSESWYSILKAFKPSILVSCWSTPPVPLELVSSGVIPLRYICHVAGSVKAVVPRHFLINGGCVTNWGNLVGHIVAEHALLLILASLRNLPRWYPSANLASNGSWGNGQELGTRSLRGKKVGIHGFGSVAQGLIEILRPFDVAITVYAENVAPEEIAARHAKAGESLEMLFGQNDIVVECEALTPKRAGVVTLRHFELMPANALFVNVARGAIVDERDMEKAAAQGRIKIASDVFQVEPLPNDSQLRKHSDAILSPHIAGPTSDWYPKCGEFALNNIRRYLAGKSLDGNVTLAIYDRST